MHGADTAWPGGPRLTAMLPRARRPRGRRAGVEDHSPEPPGLGRSPLFDQDGEVAQGEVVVDALVDATELVGTLESQDPPPAGFGLGRLAALRCRTALRKCSSASSSGSIRRPSKHAPRAARRRRLTSPGTRRRSRPDCRVRRVFDDAPPRKNRGTGAGQGSPVVGNGLRSVNGSRHLICRGLP